MSTHMGSRWYRAPEVSLVQPYDNASDMWGLGCILYELLKSTIIPSETNESTVKKSALFQGDYCYPLSPK